MAKDSASISEDIMKDWVRQLAQKHFREGLNCAESVFSALLDAGLIEFPPESVALTSVFGGGLGLSGGMCGALAAAAMGVSSVHGRRQPNRGSRDQIIDKLYGNPGLYRFFNQIPHRFVEKFGSTQCKELNRDFNEWFDKDRFLKCMDIVTEAAAMAVEFIYQGRREGYIQIYGENMAGKV